MQDREETLSSESLTSADSGVTERHLHYDETGRRKKEISLYYQPFYALTNRRLLGRSSCASVIYTHLLLPTY